MTELQFGACSRVTDSADIRFNSVGRATPGTQLRVADPEGKVLTDELKALLAERRFHGPRHANDADPQGDEDRAGTAVSRGCLPVS
jgi:hypothetical protein